jgi:hypothetical protein
MEAINKAQNAPNLICAFCAFLRPKYFEPFRPRFLRYLVKERIMRSAFFRPTVIILAALGSVVAGIVAHSQTPPKKTPATADVKIRQRMGAANGDGMETILYIKGPRMRSEMAGSYGMTTILQCDLKRTLTIYEKTKTYLVTSTDGTNQNAAMTEGDGGGGGVSAPVAAASPSQRGGVVNITQTLTDTGERKEMFGFTARHIKTSMVKTASPEACDKDQKVETDGWYIDFQYAFECPGQVQKHQTVPVRPQPPGCQDEVRTKTIGSAKLGFPVLVTTTIYQPDGKTTTAVQEVLELSREPLSAALFEAPEGYTLAKNVQELYGMGASASAPPSSRPSNNAGANSSSSATVGASPTATVGPKKPGMVRIGLVLPKVQLASGDTMQAAEALRSNFASYLKGPSVEVVSLSARLPAIAAEEARQSECDYVLYLSMAVKKGGGGSMFGRAIGNIAGSAVGHIPGGGPATGAARSAAIGGVYTTATIVSSIKARDEVTLEYRLEAMDRARPGVANTAKAKASSDGEDVVTGLIEKAAGAVVATASQR